MSLVLIGMSLPATFASHKKLGSVNKNVTPARAWPAAPYPADNGRAAKRSINALANNGGMFNKDDAVLTKELEHLSDHKPHNSFPPDFVFGAASAAFQVEGATKEGGKGPSIWDTFCEKYPEKIADGSSGEPGAGSYYRYKEDVQLLSEIGLKAYRFSISWSRVLPKGRGEPNEEGVAYYNKLIDELLLHGIKPYVTLFHWDVPQALEDEYGGFLCRRIVDDYKNYVNLCFERFGDRVKHWITMNEPYMFSTLGYNFGVHAPGHCTPDLVIGGSSFVCPVGDSLREPYKVAHNILLAHAEAVHLYKEKFKALFDGEVGITLVSHWFEPYDNLPSNQEAQQRSLEFMLGWFFEPIKYGNYPFSMRALVGERLPIFTPEESEKLKDSFDFVGINYYTSRYARDQPNFNYSENPTNCTDDSRADVLVDKGNIPIGPAEKNSWVNVYPKGIKKLLLYIKERYKNPPIYITENGVLEYNKERHNLVEDKAVSLPAPIDDIFRYEYHTSHLHELEDALSSRADVRGYFVWSLLDSFEWQDGYTCQFGLNYVDYRNLEKPSLNRYPKQSSRWLKRFLRNIRQSSLSAIPLADQNEPPTPLLPVHITE